MDIKIGCLLATGALSFATTLTVDASSSPSKPSLAVVGSGYAVSYTLSGEPAAVTAAFEAMDAEGAWQPLVGAATWHLEGDVNTVVEPGLNRSFRWTPGSLGPGSQAVRVTLTAWPTNGLPPYMVVDLAATSARRLRYYATTNDIPGGILDNQAYRTSEVVLRKVPAKGSSCTLGNSGSTWSASLGYDYYIGVFPVTQAQLYSVLSATRSGFTFPGDCWMRPVDSIVVTRLRLCDASSNSINYDCDYPADPASGSVLDKFRQRAENKVAFDLPGEAEWEIAARAGHGNGYWGNGTAQSGSDTDFGLPGRYSQNGDALPSGYVAADIQATGGTAIVGGYAPNDWGFYDMHGNVNEWVLDYNSSLATRQASNGVIIARTEEAKQSSWYARVRKGGTWGSGAKACYPGGRTVNLPANDETYSKLTCGFRLADRCSFGQTNRTTYVSQVSEAVAPASVAVAKSSEAVAVDTRGKVYVCGVADVIIGFFNYGLKLLFR